MISRFQKAGHTLVLSDLNSLPDIEPFYGHPFVQCDVQTGVDLQRAANGCDAILHLPTWHGIHWNKKTTVDFWRLNVDGTFWMFHAASTAGIKKVVFLSSQSWHGHYDKYGFTKRIGEELCEYHWQNHQIRYVAVRPNDFTPWNSFTQHYGPRLLHGGVDRENVLDGIALSMQWLESSSPSAGSGHLNAVRHDPFTASQLEGWSEDPVARLEKIFPGSRDLIERYAIDLKSVPSVSRGTSSDGNLSVAIGYQPRRHFGTFLEELRGFDKTLGRDGVLALQCPYAVSA